MITSLRAKLALSHILPIVLLMPVLSLFLLYTLEGFFTQTLLQQLDHQARLLRDQAEQTPQIVEDPQAAGAYLHTVAALTDARVVILAPDATVVSSTHPEDSDRLGKPYAVPSVLQALRGESVQGIGPGFTGEVAYVILPIRQNGATAGVLRLSYDVTNVRAEFIRLQWLVVAALGATIILGMVMGLGLATMITRPLRELAENTRNVAAGNLSVRVRSQSRDEVGALASSFNQMAARLEESEKLHGRQLAAITHELARPLAGMQEAVDTLLDIADTDPETRESLLTGVQDELGRLRRLVKTLQGFHKRTLRPLQITSAELALERVIRASIANFEPLAAQRGITLAEDLPRHLPVVRADADRIIQVLTNLLDNACKFTPRDGRITVQAGENLTTVWVSVADTGVGIAPEEHPHLFQQFYRGRDSRPPEMRGMGLGLAICREIITAHRGKIWVESEPGKGARFTFTLPKR